LGFNKLAFSIKSPFAALASQVRDAGDGKTTLFDLCPERDDSTMPAIIGDRANMSPPPTFLLGEGDNLDLMSNSLFRNTVAPVRSRSLERPDQAFDQFGMRGSVPPVLGP
jgi:hypothetical protein